MRYKSNKCKGKTKLTRNQAHDMIGRLKKERKVDIRPYYCEECGTHHITSYSEEIQNEKILSQLQGDTMGNLNLVKVATVCGGELAVIKLGELINSLNSGKLEEYEYNRGTEGPKKKRVEDLANQFRPESLGTITICKKGFKYELVDGHTRCRALLQAEELENLTSNDKQKLVSVMLIPHMEFLTTYKHLNNNEPHKTKHYLTNPHLPLGKLVGQLLGNGDEEILNKFFQQLAQMVVIMQEGHDTDWNDCLDNYVALANASGRVKEINKFEFNFDTDFDVNKKEWLINAIRQTQELRTELSILSANSDNVEKKKLIRKLLMNAGFFGGCLIGGVADNNKDRFIFSDLPAKEVAKRIFNRINSIYVDGKLAIARHGGQGAMELRRITKVIRKNN